jgi:hypothetical protein
MRSSITIIGIVLATPSLVLAAPATLSELSDLIVSWFNASTGVLIVAGIVVYFYGITGGMVKIKSGEMRQGVTTQLIWGVVAIFVMVSVWGILSLLQATIFGLDSSAPSSGAPQTPGESLFSVPNYGAES